MNLKKIKIIDTTLREGMQNHGICFNAEQSVEIAAALKSVGVEIIKAGHPLISNQEMDRVRAVANSLGNIGGMGGMM